MRTFKRASQQGRRREKTGGVASSYVEDFFEPRTKLEARFNVPQWRKWRMPVRIIAIPCSSTALVTSASRMDPPG